MLYTVKEIASMARVTVKTLHHYHKIGLLEPCGLSEAGYRLYGQKELERLQQILFFRELDFSLKDISEALAAESDRMKILSRQRDLIFIRIKRLELLIRNLDDSITHAKRNEHMSNEDLFTGFTAEGWKEALREQSDYLKEKYAYDLLQANPIPVDHMNEMAQEGIHFQNGLVQALRGGIYCQDSVVQSLLADHLAFLNAHGHGLDPQGFMKQVRFLVSDEFHRKMMEAAQVGLSYYFLAAVEAFYAASLQGQV